MPRLTLALDTSSRALSLAVLEGPVVRLAQVVDAGPRQAELLPGLLVEALGQVGAGLSDVERLVVGLGPGSFTGLRVGLATLKGLAYALKVPLVGASSLQALAAEGPPGRDLLACALVKKGELYLGPYRREGDAVVARGEETSGRLDEVAALLAREPRTLLLGPGLEGAPGEALLALGVSPEQLLPSPRVPSAVALAALAPAATAYDAAAVMALVPSYLRGSWAEENPRFPPLATGKG